MANDRQIIRRPVRGIEIVMLGVACPTFLCLLIFAYGRVKASDNTAPPQAANEPGSQDFSRFRHNSAQHQRMPCLLCHTRATNSAAIKMPGHIPCSSCHVQQFADNTGPICTICHSGASVKQFPALRSFSAVFDHSKHMRQTNCGTCHRSTRQGIAFSIPARQNAHGLCFQCHTPRAMSGGKNIGSCSTCHRPGSPARTSEFAMAFAVNFSHVEHTRKGLNCSACHTVRAGMARGRQVSSPRASMHFAKPGVSSCAACHDNRRAFGGVDFSDCRKCHQGQTFKF